MENTSKKRKYSPDTKKKKKFPLISFAEQWNTLPWNMKHYLCEATHFFSLYPEVNDIIVNLKTRYTKIHDISFAKLVFHFICVVSDQYHRSCSKKLDKTDISLFNSCASFLQVIGKKNLDPFQKEFKPVTWPHLSPTLLLSVSEVLFYWFILRYEVAHYVEKNEQEITALYIKDRHCRISVVVNPTLPKADVSFCESTPNKTELFSVAHC